MIPLLGVDPGSTSGAAVLLDSTAEHVRTWCCWWASQRKSGRVFLAAREGIEGRRVLGSPLEVLTRWSARVDTLAPVGYYLAVEGLFAVRGKVGPHTMLKLGESAGEAIGVLYPSSVGGPPYRPLARNGWRMRVLGLPGNVQADDAEAYAVERAPMLFGWPGEGFPVALPRVARGALAEAACIARDNSHRGSDG